MMWIPDDQTNKTGSIAPPLLSSHKPLSYAKQSHLTSSVSANIQPLICFSQWKKIQINQKSMSIAIASWLGRRKRSLFIKMDAQAYSVALS